MRDMLHGVQPQLRDYLGLMGKAQAGDMVWVVSPATTSKAAQATAWTRTVRIELQTAAGEIHEWFTKDITSGASVADTSTAGTATIPSTTLTVVNGIAEVIVSGNAQNWLATETNTLTIAAATIMGYTVASKTSVETFT
jgi:hypothetical protein